MMMTDKGQVTIFVIVAMVIVFAIFFLFLINKKDVSLREQDFDDITGYISNCLTERSNLIIEKMLDGGGFLNSNDTILYENNFVTYLCKNINNFESCVNQYPNYIKDVEDEFEKNIFGDSKVCIESLKQELTNRGYEFNSKDYIIEAKLKEGIVEVSLNGDFYMAKDETTKKFSEFNILIRSSLMGLSTIANEIVSQEARWCYFSNEGFMTLYPEYDIRVYMMEDTTKIYTIKDKRNGEKLKMATLGCALPAGLL